MTGSSPDSPKSLPPAAVAYLFLTEKTLPLAPAWRVYFDGCPEGSYTVHIHAQRTSAAPPELQEAKMVGDPAQGSLRFRYSMQEAMLKLYRDAAATTIPDGYRPNWAQMLSDSCAPVLSCARYHELLQARQGQSLFRGHSAGGWYASPAHWPAGFQAQQWFWQSQWCTLWMEHARMLLAHEVENFELWKNSGTPDEYYTINILSALGANVTLDGGLTKVSHGYGAKPQGKGSGGHPGLITCSTTGVHLLYVDSESGVEDTPTSAMHVHQQDLVQARTEMVAATDNTQLFQRVRAHQLTIDEMPPDARAEFDRLMRDAATEGYAFARKFAPACVELIAANARAQRVEQSSHATRKEVRAYVT